ncbi:putative membrane protein [Wickerhamomyces ciferrii]|uniref:Membrane protein n=1 Tax=Wickerhamomyces ciferrii (strain ATCC 14091 / BCRC 22168 / CBS 111 / JCM 3599 / NBRC 0793 / NRRL Y-1031 F-60-10) TaxID=1206466 RepID=K0KIQ7_WICCF|nr:uncharacterized protein BN7_2421 [Wickerhamomyces ciferrii]CCH42876.1 putative membrane protein [Wickerhamomyces ciferrii]
MKLPLPQRVYRAHIATMNEVPKILQFQKELAEAELHNLQKDFEILSKRFEEDIHFKINQIYVSINATEGDFEKIYAIRLMIYNEYCTIDDSISNLGLRTHLFVAIINAIYLIVLIICNWVSIPDWSGITKNEQDMFQFIIDKSRDGEDTITPLNQKLLIKIIPNTVNDQNLYAMAKLRTFTCLSLSWYTFFFTLSYFIPGRKDWVLFNFKLFHFRLQKRSIIYLILILSSITFGITTSQLVDQLYFKLIKGMVPAVSERVVRLMRPK